MSQFEQLSEKLEDNAARLADDSAGLQILGAKDFIDDVGAVTLLAQDLSAIAIRQADLAFRDYAALALASGSPAQAWLRWAGSRIRHRSEGMLETVRTVGAETDRLSAAHKSMWASYRKVL